MQPEKKKAVNALLLFHESNFIFLYGHSCQMCFVFSFFCQKARRFALVMEREQSLTCTAFECDLLFIILKMPSSPSVLDLIFLLQTALAASL